MIRPAPTSTLLPYTTLFRSYSNGMTRALGIDLGEARIGLALADDLVMMAHPLETVVVKQVPNPVEYIAKVVEKERVDTIVLRSEEHTSELQSRENLVCRLLL